MGKFLVRDLMVNTLKGAGRLVRELERPELAAMPLFGSEGWPGPSAR